MFLTRSELDVLTLHNIGYLAQKRLARGLKLNYKEAVALLTSQCLEYIRNGVDDDSELASIIRRLLGYRQVMLGVPDMIRELSFIADFVSGSRPVLISDPICNVDGDLKMALMGSFLPEPNLDWFGPFDENEQSTKLIPPGNVQILNNDSIDLNPNKLDTLLISVHNSSNSKIIVGSHYHFVEVNRALQFDRSIAYGMRLSIPSGSSFEFPAQ